MACKIIRQGYCNIKDISTSKRYTPNRIKI